MKLGAGAVRLVEQGSDHQGGRRYPWQPCERPRQQHGFTDTISGVLTYPIPKGIGE